MKINLKRAKTLLPHLFTGIGLVAISLVGMVAVLLGIVHYSASPNFCRRCHIMEPYYKSWEASAHNFVPCVDCHYSPGFRNELWGKFQATSQVVKYITHTYSTKPYAEIDDSSCLRSGCHQRNLLSSSVKFNGSVEFDHGAHLADLGQGKKLRCTSCHYQVSQDTHIEVNEVVCFACHFNSGKWATDMADTSSLCLSCHASLPTQVKYGDYVFSHQEFTDRGVKCQKCHLDIVKGDGRVDQEHCRTCHGEKEKLAKYSDPTLMHRLHITEHRVECFQCHQQIQHEVTTRMASLDYRCDICHKSMHFGVKEMYMGVGGKGVPEMPSSMFLADVDCVGCHVVPDKGHEAPDTLFTGRTFKASWVGCRSCHEAGYEEMLSDWRNTLHQELDETVQGVAKAEALFKAAHSYQSGYSEARRLLIDAKYNLHFVQYGKGIHNIEYATALLEAARGNAQKIASILSKNGEIITNELP